MCCIIRYVTVLLMIYQRTAAQMNQQGNCKIGDSSQTFLEYYVQDTERDVFVNVYTENVKSLEVTRPSKYATVALDNANLLIKPSEDYETFEETNNNNAIIAVEIKFYCAIGNLKLHVFMFHVMDTNNHSPQFIDWEENTEYSFYTPVGLGFPVLPIYGSLGAMDVDLTTKNITFDIEENEYFDISYHSSEPRGVKTVFFATLTTKQIIYSLNQPVVLNISITDNDDTGNASRSNYNGIVIKGNGKYKIPFGMKFEKVLYKGSIQDGVVQIDENISLTNEGHVNDVKIQINNDHFKAVYNNSNVLIYIEDTAVGSLMAAYMLEVKAITSDTEAYAIVFLVNDHIQTFPSISHETFIGIIILCAVLLFVTMVAFGSYTCYLSQKCKRLEESKGNQEISISRIQTVNNNPDTLAVSVENREQQMILPGKEFRKNKLFINLPSDCNDEGSNKKK